MIISNYLANFRSNLNIVRFASKEPAIFRLASSLCREDKATAALALAPLHFPSDTNTTSASLATILTNFKEAKRFYRQKVLEGNRELQEIYTGNPSLQNIFRKIFPELAQIRGITFLQQYDQDGKLFERWTQGKNDVTVELDDTDDTPQKAPHTAFAHNNENFDALFIGGPSTLTAGLLYQLRYPEHQIKHVFADRFDSNYDGSAYYYHQRDAAPVYINRVNRGPYCVYIDLYKRLINPTKLADQAEMDRHHVKISLNWKNIKPRYIFTIFIPNVWHMITDLWVKNKKNSKVAHVIQHASRAVPIVHAISAFTGIPVETMIVHSKNKANYVAFAGSNIDPKTHFAWLNKFAYIPFEEVSCEGFGSEVVQVLNFPNDGLIAPMIIETLQQQLTTQGKPLKSESEEKISRNGFQLKKLFVRPTSSNGLTRLRVVRAEFMNTRTGSTHSTIANRMFISLGPSGQIKIVPPKLTWLQHAVNVLGGTSQSTWNHAGGYTPTLLSLWRHTLNSLSNNFFRGNYCFKDFIWASGSTSIILLGVDLSKVNSTKLDVLSRFVDGVNQHWTLIAQRDVHLPITNEKGSPMKTYRFFAIQMTGGGNFPSRFIRPDYVLNLLYTTEKMYGLDVMKHAVYDIVQSRGCGRAVSAKNSIQFQSLTENAVVNYALGGIGMTTMFPNGEKMLRTIEENDPSLKETDKKSIYSEDVLQGIDYSSMVDDNKYVARALGFDNSMSMIEKQVIIGAACTSALTFLITLYM